MAWDKIALTALHLFRNKDKITGNPEDIKTLEASRKRYRMSVIMLIIAIIYWISPIDFIPGLPPFEWIEDIPILIAACLYSWHAHRKLLKARAAMESARMETVQAEPPLLADRTRDAIKEKTTP